MEEANKKMNFITRVYKAITNFDTYSKFAEEPFSKAFVYVIILTLILTLVLTLNYVLIFREKLVEGINYLSENIDEINFDDGIFSFNNNQYAEYAGDDNLIPIVIVDTSENPDIEGYKTKVGLYNFGFILLKDKVLIQTSSEQELEPITYSDYNIDNMSKEEILEMINSDKTYLYMGITIFIVEFIELLLNIFIDAIMLALLAQLISITLRMKIKFRYGYKMGIYALTLPTILQIIYIIVNSRTGFIISNFVWLYMTIAYIYILIAVLMIKTDFINTQRELIRIQLEQKKTHDEMTQQENDEKKNEEKDKKPEEKQDKKDEDKNNEDGLDEQTQE